MAYLIFNSDNNIVKIAANDSDRDSLNIVLTDHTIKDVSDSDFLKIRTGAAVATYDGTNVAITDTGNITFDEAILKFIFKNLIKTITAFLENNQSNSLYVGINNYKEYLENFDTSTLTFPIEKSWEEYCNENSITFYHPLQIP
tara:strand:+ start:682 stop:1110 length:429 start_codon:yes stop_codon:yes gene_type:complete